LFHRSAQPTRIRTDVREVGAGHRPAYLAWDLWKKRPFVTAGELNATMPARGVAMFRIHG
jgi:hypothetical protein